MSESWLVLRELVLWGPRQGGHWSFSSSAFQEAPTNSSFEFCSKAHCQHGASASGLVLAVASVAASVVAAAVMGPAYAHAHTHSRAEVSASVEMGRHDKRTQSFEHGLIWGRPGPSQPRPASAHQRPARKKGDASKRRRRRDRTRTGPTAMKAAGAATTATAITFAPGILETDLARGESRRARQRAPGLV